MRIAHRQTYSAIKFGGKTYSVRLKLNASTDGDTYKDHKIKEVNLSVFHNVEDKTNHYARSKFTSDLSISQLIQDVNQNKISKVVDENGEPMVVYHGTNGSFNEYQFYNGMRIAHRQTNRRMEIITRLDKFGDINADLTEITVLILKKDRFNPQPKRPLAEVVGQVAQHQAAGFSPLTNLNLSQSQKLIKENYKTNENSDYVNNLSVEEVVKNVTPETTKRKLSLTDEETSDIGISSVEDGNTDFVYGSDNDEFATLLDSIDRPQASGRDFDETFKDDPDYLGTDEFGGPRFSIATGIKNRQKLEDTVNKFEKVAEELNHEGFSRTDVDSFMEQTDSILRFAEALRDNNEYGMFNEVADAMPVLQWYENCPSSN